MTVDGDSGVPALSWGTHYDSNYAVWARLKEEARFMLEEAIKEAGVKIHLVDARVKTRQSYLEKIERKAYKNPEIDITDSVGLRVITLFVEDLSKVERVLNHSFDVLESDDKVDGGITSEFGYMSLHYLCRVPAHFAGPRYDRIKNIVFEVQTRTIVQDAWANLSHYLAYKGESSIPADLQRDFHALSGLFYVADKHFQMFFQASMKSEEDAAQIVDRVSFAGLPFNRATVGALLSELYPDRLEPELEDVSELVEELTAAGYRSLTDLAADLVAGQDVLPAEDMDAMERLLSSDETDELFFDSPEAMQHSKETGLFFARVGAVRVILTAKNPKYRQVRNAIDRRKANREA